MHARSDALYARSVTLFEDAMIAATARVHGLTVVTRNVADFRTFDVPLLNPFETAGKR
jgi:toxin FitB